MAKFLHVATLVVVPPLAGASAPASSLPDVEQVGVDQVKAWAKDRIREAEGSFKEAGFRRQPSPATWKDMVVYSIQVDRFNNGNFENDDLNIEDSQRRAQGAGDFSGMPGWRHGGDIQGIRDRLDYLADLGVNTLWLTPLLRHTGSYHGYCLTDPTTVDPGFGTAEELRLLVREAHQLELRVVLDVAVNHLCDQGTRYQSSPDISPCSGDLWEQHLEGEYADPQGQQKLNMSKEFFPPFRLQRFFNRCGPCSDAQMRGSGPETIFGDFTGDMFDFNTRDKDWQEIFTDLHKYWIAYADLDGFRLDAVKHVTEDFIAYFSTHVRDYARSLGKEKFYTIGEVAASAVPWQVQRLGRMSSDPEAPSLKDGVPKTLTERLRELQPVYTKDKHFPWPGLNGIYNFMLSGLMVATAKGVSHDARASIMLPSYFGSFVFGCMEYLAVMSQVTAEGEDCAAASGEMWTVLEIHDWPRFLTVHPKEAKFAQAGLGLLLTLPGAPVLYYGLEQGLNGQCPEELDEVDEKAGAAIRSLCQGGSDDALKRQDMFASGPWRLGSAVPQVSAHEHIGAASRVYHRGKQDPFLQRNHSLYMATKNLVALRKACPALARGRIVWHRSLLGSWLRRRMLTFSRILYRKAPADNSQLAGTELVVVFNYWGAKAKTPEGIDLDERITAGSYHSTLTFVNALNTSQIAKASRIGARHYLRFDGIKVAGGELAVFVAKDQLDLPPDGQAGIALCRQDTEESDAGHDLDRCGHPDVVLLYVIGGACVLLSVGCIAVLVRWRRRWFKTREWKASLISVVSFAVASASSVVVCKHFTQGKPLSAVGAALVAFLACTVALLVAAAAVLLKFLTPSGATARRPSEGIHVQLVPASATASLEKTGEAGAAGKRLPDVAEEGREGEPGGQ